MTKRERVIKALEHDNPDITPWTVGLTPEMRDKMLAYTGDPNYLDTLGNHMIHRGMIMEIPIENKPGYFKDHFNVIWNRTIDRAIGIIEEYQLTEADSNLIDALIPPVPYERIEEVAKEIEQGDDSLFKTFGLGFSLFERAWTLRGMDDLLMDMVINPEFVHDLLNAIADWNVACLEYAMQWKFDAVCFGDDWGMQKGLIMGPKNWRVFIKPALKRMYDKVHEHDRYVLQHSCGDIAEVYPDLIEIGLNAHQTFQPEIYDVVKMKELYAGKLTFWGGISTQQLLPFATPDKVTEACQKLIEQVGKGGGLIISPTHGITKDTPPENIVAMVEAFKAQELS